MANADVLDILPDTILQANRGTANKDEIIRDKVSSLHFIFIVQNKFYQIRFMFSIEKMFEKTYSSTRRYEA